MKIEIKAERAPEGILILGREVENDVTEVTFDCSAWAEEYGDGTISLVYRRSADVEAYPITIVQDGATATWTISSTDLAYKGAGEAQLFYFVGDQIKAGYILKTMVQRSLTSTQNPPEPWIPWVTMFQGLAESAQSSETWALRHEQNARQWASTALEVRDNLTSIDYSAEVGASSGTPSVYLEVAYTADDVISAMHWVFDGLKGEPGRDGALDILFVDELPTEDIQERTIYCVPSEHPTTENQRDEYIYNFDEEEWERLGNIDLDLTNYIQKLSTFTAGNFLSISSDGGIQDSGKKAADFATVAQLAQKADSDDVDAALALKADSDDVDEALALKANTEDVTEALEEKVGFTDYATESTAGVVKVGDASNGLEMSSGTLRCAAATEALITQKTNAYAPIVPATVDFAVAKALESNAAVTTEAQKDAICQTIGAMREGGGGGGGLTTRTLSAADNPSSTSATWTEAGQELNVMMLFSRRLDIDTDNILFIVAKFSHYPYDYTVIGQVHSISVTPYQTQITVTVPNFKPKSWISSSNNISMTIVYDGQ